MRKSFLISSKNTTVDPLVNLTFDTLPNLKQRGKREREGEAHHSVMKAGPRD